MGFSAEKTYDIEAWIPSEKKYREISSCSSCGSFKPEEWELNIKLIMEMNLLEHLNGSGLAVGRLMIALLENNQNEDGSINIPNVLKKYMNNLRKNLIIIYLLSKVFSYNCSCMSGQGIAQFIPLILIFIIFYFF